MSNQLGSTKSGQHQIASDTLLGAAHGPLAERLAIGRLPDYLIVSYDRLRETVMLAEFIDGLSIDTARLRARKPLAAGARRADWIGATIDLTGIERLVVVGPSLNPEFLRWQSIAEENY